MLKILHRFSGFGFVRVSAVRYLIVALALVSVAGLALAQLRDSALPSPGQRDVIGLQKKKAVAFFQPDSKPFGQSYAEWGADWWRWALAIPAPHMPIIDPTGDSCAVGQHGPVWFLAGTFGGGAVRSCAVPADKGLFFPLINCEWENAWVGQPVLTIEELYALCAPPGPPALTLEVDGEPVIPSDDGDGDDGDDFSLLDFRATSDLFDYSLPADNLFGQPQGVYYPAISDGWWMMLKPLAPGSHTVHFTADNLFGFTLDVTYNLEVIALEGLCASPPCP